MKLHFVYLIIIPLLTLNCGAKIMRNNALMNKMVTNFQKDNLSVETETERKQNPEKVMSLMQNVLCKNFPSIPCDVITNDKTLNKLIERSIQQINYKKMAIDRTTQPPDLTLFPVVNSEELSNFLKVREPSTLSKHKKKHKKMAKKIEKKPQEYTKKIKRKESKRTSVYNGRKKLRKFYPHKVKYKDKGRDVKDFGEYSEEKLSMSVEAPDSPLEGKRQHFSYKMDPESSVWRIDYTKHGEPSLNVVAFDERLRGKTGPNVVVDEMLNQNARKDVLHPDVYIKKNFVKKNLMDLHSDGID